MDNDVKQIRTKNVQDYIAKNSEGKDFSSYIKDGKAYIEFDPREYGSDESFFLQDEHAKLFVTATLYKLCGKTLESVEFARKKNNASTWTAHGIISTKTYPNGIDLLYEEYNPESLKVKRDNGFAKWISKLWNLKPHLSNG